MKTLTSIDQVNILLKKANRMGWEITHFKTYETTKAVYCHLKDGGCITIYTLDENAKLHFNLI